MVRGLWSWLPTRPAPLPATAPPRHRPHPGRPDPTPALSLGPPRQRGFLPDPAHKGSLLGPQQDRAWLVEESSGRKALSESAAGIINPPVLPGAPKTVESPKGCERGSIWLRQGRGGNTWAGQVGPGPLVPLTGAGGPSPARSQARWAWDCSGGQRAGPHFPRPSS